jgi:hypothetical protein
VRWQIEVIAVAHQEVLGARDARGARERCARPRCEIERLFEGLVALSKDFLRHMREVTDLAQGARHVCLATRDGDTRCDHGVERALIFAFECSGPESAI